VCPREVEFGQVDFSRIVEVFLKIEYDHMRLLNHNDGRNFLDGRRIFGGPEHQLVQSCRPDRVALYAVENEGGG